MNEKAKAGFTLVEMLVTLLIMVFLVTGIGVGMSSGMKTYQESIFESDSAMMADAINTSLEDMLRHSENVTEVRNEETEALLKLKFTNYEYGISNGYFTYNPTAQSPYKIDLNGGMLWIATGTDASVPLINSGAYPNMILRDFQIAYHSEGTDEGYFEISYEIVHELDASLTREVKTYVRMI